MDSLSGSQAVAPRAGAFPLPRLGAGLRLFAPGLSGRRHLPAIPLWQAAGVATVNFVLLAPWTLVMQTTFEWWLRHNSGRSIVFSMPLQIISIPGSRSNAPNDWLGLFSAVTQADCLQLRHVPALELIAPVGLLGVAWLCSIGMLFFMLLPLAARPGSNRACVYHVLKVSLLGTNALHLIGLVLAAFCMVGARRGWDLEGFVGAVRGVAMFCAVAIYGVIALASASKIEYRAAHELPQPQEPRCEFCGYSLLFAPLEGRCPECGRPVIDSLGEHARQPTAWEQAPQWWNPWAVAALACAVVFRPRQLFSHMLAGQGKAAAERWLVLCITLVAGAAFWIVPLMLRIVQGKTALNDPQTLIGAFVMGVIWAGLGLMMVGIETGGVAIVAHFRGQHVDLGAAAKVTAYASILLLFWVLLGGAHLTAALLVTDQSWWLRLKPPMRWWIGYGSLTAAQIGGLVWFEMTVYRGLSVVRWANR